jgi:uncharacterized protein YfaP (DUF2135 family)
VNSLIGGRRVTGMKVDLGFGPDVFARPAPQPGQ